MFAKCQYMDELTGGKGITFATGTPISNSMTELYTNMRYLQYNTLQKLGLSNFDSWAATFGETQTAIELAPEGTGYRAKTRFAKFFNLPELIALFKESADIQTPDMLKLPVPEAEYENVVLKPSEHQKEMVASLAERAEAVRDRRVEAHIDNMLKITNDGRKLALDQRLINDMLPDDDNSKATTCVDKAFEIWEDTKEQKSAQLIFCDLSTPKGDGTFNVYEDIREYLSKYHPEDLQKLFLYEDATLPLSALYNLSRDLERALSKHVWMKSGAYLVIESTEACTVIDVNTGKFDGKNKDKQKTFLKIDLEAAKEVANQIRLRNLSGIILVDFIDLEKEEDREHLMQEFHKYLKKDSVPTTLVDLTKLQIAELTRKKVKKPLHEQIALKDLKRE